ncbi:MAG: copper transporter [Firmicutes bacterium]|nr:copper transporter [Bacillota bacterium]
MFEYRSYTLVIVAIFLALALGILIGIAFGEDALVSNQKETIELMEHRLNDLRDNLADRQDELKRWRELAPRVLNSFSSSLAGKNILLLTDGDPRARELYQLLRENGAETCLVAIPETPPAGLKFEIEFASELAAALAGEEGAVAGLEAYDDLDILGRLTGCPDSIILTPSPGPAALPGQLFLGLLEEELLASGNRVVIAFPGGGSGGIGAKGTRVAEDVDTFWGKFTLLGILSEDGEEVDPGKREGAPGWR